MYRRTLVKDNKFFGDFMLQTIEDSCKNEKIARNAHPKAPQMLLFEQNTKGITEADLIDCEAGVMFLEEMVKWLETFVQLRKKNTGSHFNKVEKRVDELSTDFLESCKRELQASVATWGRRPFEDYIHEKGVYK